MRHRPVDPQQAFPALELDVLGRWRERDVFGESIRRRAQAEPWVFYEGPPTANGPPGSHHVLARVFKDLYPRFRTMCGYRVDRKGGWDCHGLPVEIAVEEELGITSKAQIESYGIAEFNERCRESVFAYVEEWKALTERIGFWLDLDHAYRTLDNDYIESVWWALAELYRRELLYEGQKVVPHCPRCETTLSSHEVAQGYRDVSDPSVYVRLPVTRGAGPVKAGDELVVWTTTPWTLVSNAAVAVNPELEYVRARPPAHPGGEGAPPSGGARPALVVAAPVVRSLLGEDAEVIERFPGSELVGVAYRPPFDFIPAEAYGELAHTVLPTDFVSAQEGTGLVHTAIAFGEDDFRLGTENGLAVINPVRPDGTFDERIGPYAGRFVKDADDDLVADLERRGLVLAAGRYEHSYPHCWRCGTPLLYYAKPSWYIATSRLRERLLAANEEVTWYPAHIKHGRFGDWLANNVDWALSRERYWGTPLPIWRCPEGHVRCVGSFAELERLSGVPVTDPHRPFVDDMQWECDRCSEPMRRVPEIIDVWFDSGAMPFAQHHAPFENEDLFDARFPADFVCEALDQTRGWFYSLLAISTLLFDRAPYRNVVCLGLILDPEGQKMSKSRGNIVVPWDVIDRYGADALRWYFFTSKQPWDGYRFATETIGDGVRLFLRQLWSTYHFYVLYANADEPDLAAAGPGTDLDRWARSRLAAVVGEVREGLERFDATRAGRAIAQLVDDLSNWYVRRSRRRFWDGDPDAFATLHQCLVTISKLLAPFTPFVADEIYDNLDAGEPSVHLCDFPHPGPREADLEFAMATARETVRLGLAARKQAGIKVRQPLRAAVVVAQGSEREAIERLSGVVADELNVKEVRFVTATEELGTYEVKPNYPALGPRFGSAMPRVAAALAALDPQGVAEAVRAPRPLGISVDGREHQLAPDDVQLILRPREGYGLEREGSHAVALELELDEDLRREGWAREVVHAVQAARKETGLAVEDRIQLALAGDSALVEAARSHRAYVARETLAVEVSFPPAIEDGRMAVIERRELRIALERA